MAEPLIVYICDECGEANIGAIRHLRRCISRHARRVEYVERAKLIDLIDAVHVGLHEGHCDRVLGERVATIMQAAGIEPLELPEIRGGA